MIQQNENDFISHKKFSSIHIKEIIKEFEILLS